MLEHRCGIWSHSSSRPGTVYAKELKHRVRKSFSDEIIEVNGSEETMRIKFAGS